MQALFAAPLCSVHPWRSPNCKTRAGYDSQASSLTAGAVARSWEGPVAFGQIFGFNGPC